MLFEINRGDGSFGVGQEGMVSWDSHRRSLLSPKFILFPICAEFFKRLPIKLHHMFIIGELLLLYFRTRPPLQHTIPCSWQNMNRWQSINHHHFEWCTAYHRFYFLCFYFSCFWREKGGRDRETPISVNYNFLFIVVGCTPIFSSTQGSAQPSETRKRCIGQPDFPEF